MFDSASATFCRQQNDVCKRSKATSGLSKQPNNENVIINIVNSALVNDVPKLNAKRRVCVINSTIFTIAPLDNRVA